MCVRPRLVCTRLNTDRSTGDRLISTQDHVASARRSQTVSLDTVFFFFQAEDGIRDWSVTGVQTCALPIYPDRNWHRFLWRGTRSLPISIGVVSDGRCLRTDEREKDRLSSCRPQDRRGNLADRKSVV